MQDVDGVYRESSNSAFHELLVQFTETFESGTASRPVPVLTITSLTLMSFPIAACANETPKRSYVALRCRLRGLLEVYMLRMHLPVLTGFSGMLHLRVTKECARNR